MTGADNNGPSIGLAKGVELTEAELELTIARECQVIGSVFLNADSWSAVSELSPEDFCVAEYRQAWRSIRGFAMAGEAHKLTPLAIAQAAKVDSRLLLRCVAQVVTSANAADFARDMRASRALREAMSAARQAQLETDPAKMGAALQRASKIIFDIREFNEQTAPSLSDRFLDRFGAMSRGEIPAAPSTGIHDLDKKIGGLVPGDLQVWAGRPGAGKTVSTMSIARQAAHAGAFVGYFSLEIGEEQFSARLIADEAYTGHENDVYFSSLMRGQDYHRKDEIAEAAYRVRNLALRVSFTAGMTTADIETTVKRWEDQEGRHMDAVFVDYSAFVRDSGQYRGQAAKQVGEIFLDFKQMARRRNTCAVVVHQLNRGVEQRDDKRPNMADLRDSGEVEQHADSVNLLYREEYYLDKLKSDGLSSEENIALQQRKDKAKGKVEIISDKNRSGKTGSIICNISVGHNALRQAPPGTNE